jgi:hypothetical protein
LDNSNTIETGERFCLQSSPIAADKGEAQTAAVRQGAQALYFWLYPNFMINVYEGVMDTNLVIPRGIDKTEVVFDYYFADVSEAAREKNLASIAVSEQIQSEDVAICESVERGLNSRAYNSGRLSVRREAGEHLFHRLLQRICRQKASADQRSASVLSFVRNAFLVLPYRHFAANLFGVVALNFWTFRCTKSSTVAGTTALRIREVSRRNDLEVDASGRAAQRAGAERRQHCAPLPTRRCRQGSGGVARRLAGADS